MVHNKAHLRWQLIAKYGSALAVLSFFFSVLKNRLYFNYYTWDVYAGIVAVLFLAVGIFVSKVYFSNSTEKKEAPTAVLSKREAEVMNLLCCAKTNQQIADELCIELSTLKTHINRIYKKLEVKNRRQLMAVVCP